MKLSAVLFGLSAGYRYGSQETFDTCSTTGATHGWDLTCPDNASVVGFCASGRYQDCANNSVSHEYICCDQDALSTPHRNCYEKEGTHGEDLVCNSVDEVVVGGCASGNYKDCKRGKQVT